MTPLPPDHLEPVNGWGESWRTAGYVFRPSTVGGARDVLASARARGLTVALRGAGRSYGDAATGAEQIVLDLSRLTRILDWNPQTGRIVVEPGVTIRQTWQYVLEDGWWPPVVSGTQSVTWGGAAAMNIHGKNQFRVGTLGEHVVGFELLLPSGETRTCSPTENSGLFYAAIGSFGMLGVFTSLTLQLQKVGSGLLDVRQEAGRDLDALLNQVDAETTHADFVVGWVDTWATGAALGRGLLLSARYLGDGEDAHSERSLRPDAQNPPDTLFGVVPKSQLWRLMRPLVNDVGTRLLSDLRYRAGARQAGRARREPLAQFHFLLDYVPDWKRAYGPGGLVQYQAFVPKETASDTFRAQLELCQQAGHVSYLAVLKRHRPDPFLLSYGGDGYSLALDFKVTARSRDDLWALAARMDRLVLDAGGRFYFAKDSTLHPARLEEFLRSSRVQAFLSLKAECDPDNLLQTDLWRRLFVSPAQ